MWNVSNYLIFKENFLCIFLMHFANLWLLSCLLLRGLFGWSLAFSRFLHVIALVFLLFITTSVWGRGFGGGVWWGCFCQTTHFILVSGGIWAGYDACLSFIPLLPDGNQLITHYYCFFRHGANPEQIASCSVGKKVHCSILIKTADFLLKDKQHHQTWCRLWWKHLAVQCSI